MALTRSSHAPFCNGVYLDYAATTPVAPPVVEAMNTCLDIDGVFGNAASNWHSWGNDAREAIENARATVAKLVNASPAEIIWTSGATEANNLAIKGAVEATGETGGHIVTSSIEHPAVLDTVRYLETRGYEATYLNPDKDGLIDPGAVLHAIRNDTILVTLMHVNNEIGTVNDIGAIGRITRERDILFHVDATQGLARLKVDVGKAGIDLLSLSGHKIYGPKGVGALFVSRRPRASLIPQIHGGGHEHGLRSGTLPTHQIVGLGEAARLLVENFEEFTTHMGQLSNRALQGIKNWPGASINGSRDSSAEGILNITIEGIDAAALMAHLPHIAFSTGSACTSADPKPSHVLVALGLTTLECDCTIRLSFGRYTTESELDRAMSDFANAIGQLHQLSPPKEATPEQSHGRRINA